MSNAPRVKYYPKRKGILKTRYLYKKRFFSLIHRWDSSPPNESTLKGDTSLNPVLEKLKHLHLMIKKGLQLEPNSSVYNNFRNKISQEYHEFQKYN